MAQSDEKGKGATGSPVFKEMFTMFSLQKAPVALSAHVGAVCWGSSFLMLPRVGTEKGKDCLFVQRLYNT